MEQSITNNRESLAGSAARDAEILLATAKFSYVKAGSAARTAEESRPGYVHGAGVTGFKLRAQGGLVRRNQDPAPIHSGPSARSALTWEPTAAVTVSRVQISQALYPDTPRLGTLTSIGVRLKHAIQSLFVQ